MSAINIVRVAMQNLREDSDTTIQFGFPYVDTLKSQQTFGNNVHFFGKGDETDLTDFQKKVTANHTKISAIFLEFPTNPLLKAADLEVISSIARKYKIPVVIDDTLAPPMNADLSEYADIFVTSLSKFASGEGNVLAGSIVINPKSPLAESLKSAVENIHKPTLYKDDAIILAQNISDWEQRMEQINKTTARLVKYLRNHSAIETVHYADSDIYNKYAEHGGGLFSVELKNPDNAPDFYDRLNICKGPGLGTNFTLACPYTLLAHYQELEWADQYGISPHLIRVSIGLEDFADLRTRFSDALTGL